MDSYPKLNDKVHQRTSRLVSRQSSAVEVIIQVLHVQLSAQLTVPQEQWDVPVAAGAPIYLRHRLGPCTLKGVVKLQLAGIYLRLVRDNKDPPVWVTRRLDWCRGLGALCHARQFVYEDLQLLSPQRSMIPEMSGLTVPFTWT